jgi:hypothetical protein
MLTFFIGIVLRKVEVQNYQQLMQRYANHQLLNFVDLLGVTNVS